MFVCVCVCACVCVCVCVLSWSNDQQTRVQYAGRPEVEKLLLLKLKENICAQAESVFVGLTPNSQLTRCLVI